MTDRSTTILVSLIALLSAGSAFAQDGKHAPLPDKLVAARTVFLTNETGEEGFTDAVVAQLHDWGRWRVVANRDQADVVIALDHHDRFHNFFYLRVVDRTSGEVLWTRQRDASIRIWGRLGRILMADLRTRLPPAPDAAK